jgi:hypothetical protein
MATTEFSVEVAVNALVEEGFVDLHDLEAGDHVLEMEQNRFDFLSIYGLGYCNQHILSNSVCYLRCFLPPLSDVT